MRRNKYGNKKVIVDGYKFDSTKEAKRYRELKLLLKIGKITELTLQPSFLLQDSFKDSNGDYYRAIKYISDFKYIKDEKEVVEDVKASKKFKTDVYRIKKKLFLFKYQHIEFIEVY